MPKQLLDLCLYYLRSLRFGSYNRHCVPLGFRNYPPDDVELVKKKYSEILADLDEPDQWFTHRIVKTSGDERHVRVQTRLIYEGEGSNKRIKILVGTLTDITQQYDYEQKLRKQKRIAESANASNSEFVAKMSHETRAPMTAIFGNR